jgi:hypothetical protein
VLRINGDLMGVGVQGHLQHRQLGVGDPARLDCCPRVSAGERQTATFGLRCLDNTTVNIAGLSRTSGKNVSKCKLTADVTGSNVLTSGPTALNVTNATSGGLDIGNVAARFDCDRHRNQCEPHARVVRP